MHDAPRRMRSFPSNCELAFEVAIERNSVMQQIMDTRAGFARQSQRDRFVDQPPADGDRIGGMALPPLALATRRPHPAFPPRPQPPQPDTPPRTQRHPALL